MNINWAVLDLLEDFKKSDVFARYQKDFAKFLSSKLIKHYSEGEVPLVEEFDDLVKNYPNLSTLNQRAGSTKFDINTNSVFVHGNKVQIDFDYSDKRYKSVELGDLIFICSFIFQGKRQFERMTITQFKMEDKKKKTCWTINNPKQLYLLSHFPKFKCVRGMLPKNKEYSLPNLSDCLGSYGLIKRGDFAFISATDLHSILPDNKIIKQSNLYMNSTAHRRINLGYFIIDNCHICLHSYSFAYNYLGLNIGEPLIAPYGQYNLQARALLSHLISTLKLKNLQSQPNIAKLIESFSQFPYADNLAQRDFIESDFGLDDGIGIIHTSIRAGE